MTKFLTLSSTFLGLCSLVAMGSTAQADGISVRASGSVSVSAGVHVRVGGAASEMAASVDRAVSRVRYSVPPASVRVGIASRRYRRPIYRPRPRPAAVPSYYVHRQVYAPRPVYVQQPVAAPVVYAAPQPMRRWSLGAFMGSVDVDGQSESGSDLGLIAQYRLTPSFSLEGELSATDHQEIGRTDSRVGAAVLYDFVKTASVSTYVLAGAGYSQVQEGEGELHAEQGYGEVGLGLRLQVSDRFQLLADLRVGERQTQGDVAYRTSEPIAPELSEEQYGRFRLGGLFSF